MNFRQRLTTIYTKRISFHKRLPLLLTVFSLIGCLAFFRIYLLQTSQQTGSELLTQNKKALQYGDSYEIAAQLNAIYNSPTTVCVDAARGETIFFHRAKSANCNEGYWQTVVSIPREPSLIKMRLVLTLPHALKWAEVAFCLIQLIVFWSLFAVTRSFVRNEVFHQNLAERRLFEFARQVAHDIRAPLSALNAIAASLGKTDERANLLQTVVNRISNIASDILPSNTEASTRSKCAIVSCAELPKLISAVITEHTYLVNDNVEVKFSNQSKLDGNLFVDVSAFQRVVGILIDNSCHACKQGEIIISLLDGEGTVCLSVCDTGHGIPADLIPKLFKNHATFGKKGGNGLGLSYAKSQVNSWKGKIGIVSAALEGTTVTVELPIISV